MTEELLKQLVQGQEQINKRFDSLEARFDSLEARFDGLETRFDGLETRFDSLETRFDNLEGQTRENTDFIKALLHRTEELDAKLDNLILNTASKESIADLSAQFRVLNDRLFRQEVEVDKLKAVR